MNKNGKRFALVSILAAGAGYVAGILTAPKSGKETRHDIAGAAGKARSQAEHSLKQMNKELDDLLTKSKRKGSELKASAKAEFDSKLATAQATKEKIRVMLSAVHEGDASDEDLDRAVKEGRQAIKHLKTYFAKDVKTPQQ